MSNLKCLEKVLRECKNYKTIIKILELNKKIHAKDNEYIEKQNKKIEYYKKMNLNVERCLQTLSKDELEFIKEIYFNNKTYREIINLIFVFSFFVWLIFTSSDRSSSIVTLYNFDIS